MTSDALPAGRLRPRPVSLASTVLAGLLLAAAGAYAGAASETGAAGVALGCALVAVPAALALAGRGERPFSTGEKALLALALLAALQALPMPVALARVLAPYALDARERALGTDGGVRASFDAGATWRAALVVVGLAFLLRALRVAAERRGAFLLARCLSLVLLAHAGAALLHGAYGQRERLMGGFEITNPLNAWGTFVNRFQFSAYATALMGSAFALAVASRHALDRLLGVVAGGVGIVAVALSGSRAGLLGSGLALAFAIVTAVPRRRRLVVVGAFAALAIGVASLRAAGWGPLERVFPLRPGEGKRFEVWQGTIDLASRQPVVGVGAAAFRSAYTGDDRPIANKAVTVAESDVLQAAAEVGLVGLVLLGFALTAAARSLAARRRASDDDGRRASRVAASGLVGLLPLVLLASPLHAPAVALAAVLAWALVSGLAAPPRASPGSASA